MEPSKKQIEDLERALMAEKMGFSIVEKQLQEYMMDHELLLKCPFIRATFVSICRKWNIHQQLGTPKCFIHLIYWAVDTLATAK